MFFNEQGSFNLEVGTANTRGMLILDLLIDNKVLRQPQKMHLVFWK